MIKNQDGTYIYLTVPEKYNCVYKNILVRLADLGINIIEDCTATCRGKNRHVINCWNMFQAACAAHELGEIKRANLLINYIIGQLKFECSKIYPDEEEEEAEVVKYASLSGFSLPNISNGNGAVNTKITSINLTIENPDEIDKDSLKLYDTTNNIVLANINEIKNNPSTGEITISIAEGTSKSFVVKAKTNNKEIQSNIVTITRNKVTATTYNYYGINENISATNVTSGTKTKDNQFTVDNVTSSMLWIAAPSNKKVTVADSGAPDINKYITNSANPLASIQYTTVSAIIDNTSYTIHKLNRGRAFNKSFIITIN